MATSEPDPTAPKAFVSYSWDDEAHKEWVRELATRLRADGVDVTLDRWHSAPGDQIPAFMERAVRENDCVIAVCTPQFKERSEERRGGVGYEGDIMTAYALTGGDKRKFIPLLRRGSWGEAAPTWLLGRAYIDLSKDPYSEAEYEELLRTLHGAREKAPPVGPRPNFEDKKGLQTGPAPLPVNTFVGSSTPQHRSSVTPGMTESTAGRSVLGPFWDYLADYKKLLAAIIALGAAPALTDLVFAIGPPWPHRRGIVLLTSLVAWVVLLWSFSAWRLGTQTFLKSRLSICASVTVASLMVYILLHAFFVNDAPDTRHQEAAGFITRPQIQLVLEREPDVTVKDLWKGAEYDPTAVWVPWTVHLVRSALIFSWMVLFGGLSLVASAFLLLQENLGLGRGLQPWGDMAPAGLITAVAESNSHPSRATLEAAHANTVPEHGDATS